MKIKIGYLYGKIMNLYGDRGNIQTLINRASWRGFDYEVVDIGVNDKINYKEFDMYFWGGGQDREQNLASADILGDKAKSLIEGVNNGAALLSICGGYQLLGKHYKPAQSDELPGAALFDVHTIAGNKRMTGNIIIESEQIGVKKFALLTMVGFENHSGKTYLGKGAKPLGKVVVGFGNNGEDRTEGCIYKNAIGCYLHGPVLPKNPQLADFLLLAAIRHQDPEFEALKPLDDQLEQTTHDSVITHIKQSR